MKAELFVKAIGKTHTVDVQSVSDSLDALPEQEKAKICNAVGFKISRQRLCGRPNHYQKELLHFPRGADDKMSLFPKIELNLKRIHNKSEGGDWS